MASLPTACPAASDEVAEAFVRGTLLPDRAIFFERHTACCPNCAEEVENTGEFVLAMCDALSAIQLDIQVPGMNGYRLPLRRSLAPRSWLRRSLNFKREFPIPRAGGLSV